APVNDTPKNPAASLLAAQTFDYDQAVTRALLERPDYLAAQYTAQAAAYNVRATRAGLLPSLSGSASYGTNSTTASGTDFRTSGSAGLTLSIPIFDQGITRVQIAQAQAQEDIANSELDESKLTVQLNVRQALVGLISAEAAVGQAQAELSKATEILH